jgi:ribonuclease VapC
MVKSRHAYRTGVRLPYVVERLSCYGADGVRDLDLFIAKAQISLAPVDEEQANLARRAFRKYGKGRHPAGLNSGDCFSYALSKALQESLLFKGNDFSQTDVDSHPDSASG